MHPRLLRFGAEHGIAAADIGHHGMGASDRVSQRHAVLLARAAAIAIAGAGGEKAAKNTVLGVKDGQMLISDGLDAFRSGLSGEVGHLGGIEIVRGGKQREAKVEEFRGGEGVGGVEAEIANELGMRLLQDGQFSPAFGNEEAAFGETFGCSARKTRG